MRRGIKALTKPEVALLVGTMMIHYIPNMSKQICRDIHDTFTPDYVENMLQIE